MVPALVYPFILAALSNISLTAFFTVNSDLFTSFNGSSSECFLMTLTEVSLDGNLSKTAATINLQNKTRTQRAHSLRRRKWYRGTGRQCFPQWPHVLTQNGVVSVSFTASGTLQLVHDFGVHFYLTSVYMYFNLFKMSSFKKQLLHVHYYYLLFFTNWKVGVVRLILSTGLRGRTAMFKTNSLTSLQ